MARRRKNPLLGRILLVSVVVHLVALPVLAYFGAFKKIQASVMRSVVEVVPAPAPPEKEPPPKEDKPKEPAEEKKSSVQSENKSPSNLSQPKVAAASGPGAPGDASSPTVNPQGSGQAGQVPTVTAPVNGNSGAASQGATKPESAEPASPKSTASPVPPQPADKGETAPEPAKPHVPVLASAEPITRPLPEVPDDLKGEALDKTTVVMVVVSPDGKVDSASVVGSSGVAELDEMALKSVRKWTFRPATRDGEPVVGKVRVHVHFKVDE